MEIFKKIHLADINPNKLTEELTAVVSVAFTVGYHGFDRKSARLITPATEPKVVSTDKNQSDFAEIGEIRVTIRQVLSTDDQRAIDSVLTAHDPSQLTIEQQREDKDAATLIPTASSLEASAFASLNPNARTELLRRCCQLLFRGNEFVDLDTDD